MNGQRTLSGPRAVTVVGLVVGAVGIAILWAAGVEFPIYPPPGIIILLAGAIFVSLASWPWAPAVGAFLGLFVTVGFLVSGGPPNLVGREGTSVAIGTWIRLLGVPLHGFSFPPTGSGDVSPEQPPASPSAATASASRPPRSR
jgi:hypothetical protein